MIKRACTILGVLLLLSCSLPASTLADFKMTAPGYSLQFPRDHGSHPEYPTEWWYFTGHLEDAGGAAFGFELTFFRVGINPPEVQKKTSWHTPSLYIAHAAVTDDSGKRFFFDEKTSRPALGRAGAEEGRLSVWLHDWRAEMKGEEIQLSFAAEDRDGKGPFSLSLVVAPQKKVVLHGENGFSRKGAKRGEASYYSSFTRLQGSGVLTLDGSEQRVSAEAWMDHEFMSYAVDDTEIGWDWFAIQLDDGSEVMVYHLRRDGEVSEEFSKGTFIASDGSSHLLRKKEYTIDALGSWKSPHTGIEYPAGWRIRIPSRNLDLEITPTVKDQELRVEGSTGASYWEGRCTVSGESVSGNAYVELVGYR